MREVRDILSFYLLGEIGTSGQPTAEQLKLIQQAGYQTVVNLALATSDNALPNEREVVESPGMEYIHLPVEFDNPTVADFHRFYETMQARQKQKIWVHCAANLRVSAFMYLYRLKNGTSPSEAKKDLDKLWQPNLTWQNLIDEVCDRARISLAG